MTASYDIKEIRRGNSFSLGFRFKDGDGEPVDLAGSTMVFSIETANGILRKSSATANSGCEITDAADGEIEISLTPAETRALTVGRGTRYEIERWIDGEEKTLIAGSVTVVEGINNDD